METSPPPNSDSHTSDGPNVGFSEAEIEAKVAQIRDISDAPKLLSDAEVQDVLRQNDLNIIERGTHLKDIVDAIPGMDSGAQRSRPTEVESSPNDPVSMIIGKETDPRIQQLATFVVGEIRRAVKEANGDAIAAKRNLHRAYHPDLNSDEKAGIIAALINNAWDSEKSTFKFQ